jgi:hypothetical protein
MTSTTSIASNIKDATKQVMDIADSLSEEGLNRSVCLKVAGMIVLAARLEYAIDQLQGQGGKTYLAGLDDLDDL